MTPHAPAAAPSLAASAKKRNRKRTAIITTVVVLVLLLAWPIGLVMWADGQINHVDALSGAPNTPGTTYLIAGSDQRGSGGIDNPDVSGARSDTIMVLHRPTSGPAALISIPRDSFVDIPGHNSSRINASFAWGGPPLLVQTVELLTGLTIDHYVEIGFGGVEDVVNAVGGVELCSDLNVEFEPHSQFSWTPGCHHADGTQALAFSRMRYADPRGDIGRAERQQQVVGAIAGSVGPSLLFQPARQVHLIEAGLGAVATDERSGIIDLGRMALTFRAANGPDGITGTPPLGSLNYHGGAVQLDPDQGPGFWRAIADGTLPSGQVGGMP
ncbi:MAG: LCP family protein [Cellulomonadaceae bacterium]|nr:LCP family protein [Cellulomonadaceae bacterium]